MTGTPRRLLVLVCTAALAAGLLAVPARAADSKSDQYDIVVLVADLDGLRAAGVNLPEKLTTSNLAKRWQVFLDSYGKVNGKTFNVIPVTWDPADPSSFEETCVKATQDNQPFAVMNGNGYRQSSVGCITVDNDTFMFFGEGGFDELYEASGKNLVTLGLPGEAAARATVQIADEQKFFPKSAKIGILSANEPGIKAAGDTAEAEFKKAGYDVVEKVEINTVGQDAAGTQRDAAASVATFQAAGADSIAVLVPFTTSPAFFDEAQKSGAGFKYMLVDAASSLCTQFGASRTPIIVADQGIPCVTTWDTRALATKDGVKADSAFEAKCRKVFDAGFNEQTTPGVPAGDITDATGQTLTEDIPPNECVMTDLFVKALKKAGKNATSEDVYDAMLTIKKSPAPYMSNGTGGFAKNKPWFANQVHLMVLNPASTSTTPDANGLYNGCPAPVNCWIPQDLDGTEWVTVQSGA
jgi:hypothetical protein